MGANSNIEWCDHTFNPWEGCTKVSPGCAHCYAETRNKRFSGGANWGKGAPRRRTTPSNWKQPIRWNKDAGDAAQYERMHLREPRRPRVFCASLADWLDDEVPIEWLADLLDLIQRTPNLDWLLLTKRPQNFQSRVGGFGEHVNAPMALQEWVYDWFHGIPPANVWLGTTVEDQPRADERIPVLIDIPARVRFLSCEPLLGPLDLRANRWLVTGYETRHPEMPTETDVTSGEIDWVICGGESGAGARPMHPDWARSLRDQCKAAGVAFHFKQWGEWIARSQYLYKGNEAIAQAFLTRKFKSAVMRREGGIDESLGEASQSNDDDSAIEQVGKLLAGRLLDGLEHLAFPEVRP